MTVDLSSTQRTYTMIREQLKHHFQQMNIRLLGIMGEVGKWRPERSQVSPERLTDILLTVMREPEEQKAVETIRELLADWVVLSQMLDARARRIAEVRSEERRVGKEWR